MKKVIATTSSFGTEDKKPGELLARANLQLITNPHGKTLTEEQVTALIREHKPVGMIAGVEPLTASVMQAALPELKVISRVGVGWDNVDRAFAEKSGIAVHRTPDAVTGSVVELTVGLFLDLARSISLQDRQVRGGSFGKVMGSLIFGKTLGIMGCGRIGKGVAKVMQAMGCSVIGYDPFANAEELKKDGITLVSSLPDLFKNSDLISIHSAYDKSQHHIINAELLAQARKNLLLVNVARGGIIDEEALIKALQSGQLAGAGLDVFEKEPYAGPLCDVKNVVLTPHIGSYSRESRIRMEIEAVENLLKSLGV